MTKDILKQAEERGVLRDVSVSDDMHTVRRKKLDLGRASDEDVDALLEPLSGQTIDVFVNGLEAKLGAELIKAGWPDPGKRIWLEDGQWRCVHETDPEQIKSCLRNGEANWCGLAYTLQNAETLSPIWCKATLCKNIRSVRVARDKMERERATLVLGMNISAIRSRGLLPDVSRGKKTKRAASGGGQERARRNAQRNQEILAEMVRLKSSGKSVTRAAELAAKKGYGTSKTGNLSIWYRHGGGKN